MESYRQTEKAALIAVQSILNTRGSSPWEKVNHLRLAIGQLSPYHSLIVITEILVFFSERINQSAPMGKWIKQEIIAMSKKTLCMHGHHEIRGKNSLFISKHLLDVVYLLKRLSVCPVMDCGYNDDNFRLLIDVLTSMAKRSADEVSGMTVIPMAASPLNELVRQPVSPKTRPPAKSFIGLARSYYEQKNLSVEKKDIFCPSITER